jgi:serine/threonine-protein kinase
MTDERRVQQLVAEVLDSERTAEEVCAECPELLPEVRERSQQMLRIVAAELEAMFPASEPNRNTDPAAPRNPATELTTPPPLSKSLT